MDRIATALILLTTGCNFGLHSRCDVNHKGNRRAKAKRALNAEFSYGVQCTDDLPTATAHIRAAESGRRMLITRGKVVYECQRLTKAKKKMFGNEPGHRTLKGSKRLSDNDCAQEAGGTRILLLVTQGDHPRG